MTVHSSFYNAFDPNACRWLDNLQRHHKIPEGVVSSMSITNITEVGDYQYAHFFAGVGLTGSPLTSKVMVTSCSLPYYQLTCLGLRMRDVGYSGEPSTWRTPTVSDTQGGARWAIPRGALVTFKSTLKNAYLAANHFGRTESGLRVQKGKAFLLNPELSRFVMGYPTDWSCYVATEMP